MNKTMRLAGVAGLMIALLVVSGCSQSGPMPLESSFRQINLGGTTAAEVSKALPENGLLQTSNSMSSYYKEGSREELGIIRFAENSSMVIRKIYIQEQSPLGKEKFYLFIQTEVPDAMIDGVYENEFQKNTTILEYCHKALVDDAGGFSDDQPTVGLTGIARSALGIGIVQMGRNPRDAWKLGDTGFEFEHSTLGTCVLTLKELSGTVYTAEIRSETAVDILTHW